jgi:ABC-type transport system involved in multi-copper enzyme maturation permease subunit
MIKPLIWKEWHELRWKMAFGCLIVGAFVLIGFKSRIFPDIAINIFSIVGSSLLMPLFIAMGLIAEERSDGSLYTLFALPIRIKLLYVIKMILGAVVVLSPILVSLILSLLMAGGREESISDIIKWHVMGAHFAIVMFIVTVVSGMKFSSEAKVALTGIAWVGFWGLCVIVEGGMTVRYGSVSWTMIITPWGFFEVANSGGFLPVFLFHFVLCAAFFLWGARRFYQLAGRQR